MSFDPETMRIVRSWLDEGVTRLPDRVLDAVLDQVPATRQRRATWWPARRIHSMNTIIKFGLATAVVAVAVLIGFNYFGSNNVGGPGLDASTPTPEPTLAEPSPTPAGLLPEGPHVLVDEGVAMTVTIPAPDWYGEPGGGILVKNDQSDPPDGAGMIVFAGEGDISVYGDPCEWLSTRPDTAAATVDEVVTALANQPSRDASEPVDVTVDGYAGKSITLRVPDDAVFEAGRFTECDGGDFRTLVEGVDGARYHQGPGQIDKLWILDVDGEIVVIDVGYYDQTPQAVRDEQEAIVESTTFD